MHKIFTSVSLAAALALPAAAQETSAGSALTIRTTDMRIATAVLRMFESDADVAPPEEGSSVVLSLDDGGNITARTGEGSDWLRIDSDPRILMQIFAPQVQQARGMAQGMGGMTLAQTGLDFEQVNRMIGAVFAFPEQLAALRITIPKEGTPETGVDLTVEMTPVAKTWFGDLVAGLKQTGNGTPALNAPSALMTMALDVDLAAIKGPMAPFFELSRMMSGLAEADEEVRAMSDKMLDSMVGALTMAWDASNGMRMVVDVRDGDALAEMMRDPTYEKMAKASGEMLRNAELEFEANAFQHRDIQVVSTRILYDDPDMMPFGKDGVLETFSAIAGGQWVMAMMGADKDAVAGLIDRALDPEAKRKSLPKDTMMTLDVRVADLVEMMIQSGQFPPMGADMDDIAQKFSASLAKRGGKLVLQIAGK